jgi:hypothetical protein
MKAQHARIEIKLGSLGEIHLGMIYLITSEHKGAAIAAENPTAKCSKGGVTK